MKDESTKDQPSTTMSSFISISASSSMATTTKTTTVTTSSSMAMMLQPTSTPIPELSISIDAQEVTSPLLLNSCVQLDSPLVIKHLSIRPPRPFDIPEIRQHIFAQLDCNLDRAHCALVCKLWSLELRSDLWAVLDHQKWRLWETGEGLDRVELFQSRAPLVRELKTLGLREDLIVMLAGYCNQLCRLSVFGWNQAVETLIRTNSSGLKELRFHPKEAIPLSDLVRALLAPSPPTTACESSSGRVGGRERRNQKKEPAAQLESLDLGWLEIGRRSSFLSELSLSNLSLDRSIKFNLESQGNQGLISTLSPSVVRHSAKPATAGSGPGGPLFSNFPALRSLCIRFTQSARELNGNCNPHFSQFLQGCPSLEIISIGWTNPDVAATLATALQDSCRKVTQLRLNCTNGQDFDISRILLAAVDLTRLFIYSRSQLHAISSTALARHYGSLTDIDMDVGPEDGVVTLLSYCPNLVRVSITSMEDINGLVLGPEWVCSRLRYLTLYLGGQSRRIPPELMNSVKIPSSLQSMAAGAESGPRDSVWLLWLRISHLAQLHELQLERHWSQPEVTAADAEVAVHNWEARMEKARIRRERGGVYEDNSGHGDDINEPADGDQASGSRMANYYGPAGFEFLAQLKGLRSLILGFPDSFHHQSLSWMNDAWPRLEKFKYRGNLTAQRLIKSLLAHSRPKVELENIGAVEDEWA